MAKIMTKGTLLFRVNYIEEEAEKTATDNFFKGNYEKQCVKSIFMLHYRVDNSKILNHDFIIDATTS